MHSPPPPAQWNTTQTSPQSLPAENPDKQHMHGPDFLWGERDGVTFCRLILSAYNEVHWRRNIFMIPSGERWDVIRQRTGKLISSICWHHSAWMCSYEGMYRYTVSASSEATCQEQGKRSFHSFGRRLKLRLNADINALLHEGKCIQKHLFPSRQTHDPEKTARTFNRLMFLEKVHAALRVLSQNEVGGSCV